MARLPESSGRPGRQLRDRRGVRRLGPACIPPENPLNPAPSITAPNTGHSRSHRPRVPAPLPAAASSPLSPQTPVNYGVGIGPLPCSVPSVHTFQPTLPPARARAPGQPLQPARPWPGAPCRAQPRCSLFWPRASAHAVLSAWQALPSAFPWRLLCACPSSVQTSLRPSAGSDPQQLPSSQHLLTSAKHQLGLVLGLMQPQPGARVSWPQRARPGRLLTVFQNRGARL